MNIPVIVSPKYAVNIGEHVFPTGKFMKTAMRLVSEGIICETDIMEPHLPDRSDLLLVHTQEWVGKVVDGKMTAADAERAELPYSPEISEAHQLAVQGTIEACRLALSMGIGLHSGGGSHHAFADHGEGFCLLNDVAVGIRKMQRDSGLKKAMVLDLDVHQGNGTASIFKNDPSVFTFSMHQEKIFPDNRVAGTMDFELPKGTVEGPYLNILCAILPHILSEHGPELVLYQAGADCFEDDRLGGLRLTFDGMKSRDEKVFEECFSRKIPVAVVLGGGYSRDLNDTVGLHAQTLKCGINAYKKYRAKT